MPAGPKKAALESMWSSRWCLILEEVSMISPALFNMLLYRSFLGRAARWNVSESEYNKLRGAFGRIPIVIYLGDFLQLKPVGQGGSGIPLIASFREIAAKNIDLPIEFQDAMKLFHSTPVCFELQASNRFKEPRLRELMAFMRNPGTTLPEAIETSWNSACLQPNDPRLREERFQNGHMIAIYWDTVVRWMMMRAKRDAAALDTPLYLLQAADLFNPPLTDLSLAAKLMNQANPDKTGKMHSLLAIHVGMRVRLLDHLEKSGSGLVKDAEGTVVRIVVNELDERLDE